MAIGLTLMDDAVDVFLLNRRLDDSDKNTLNIETIHEMDIPLISNLEQGDKVRLMSGPEMAAALLAYDHVLPY